MTTKSKAIKQLKKQIKKLNKRVDELSEEIDGLKDASKTLATQHMAMDSEEDAAPPVWSGRKFSEEEVEMAEELTDEAEEVLDILDKGQ